MKLFSHRDQLEYVRLALTLLDNREATVKELESILEFGELIKKYTDDDNAIIYDMTDYIYEQIRLLNNEHGAYDDTKLREDLSVAVREIDHPV